MLELRKSQIALKYFIQKIKLEHSKLNELDNAIGDGDHGTNMLRGIEDFEENMNTKKYLNSSEIFNDLGMSCLSKIGGASGPLYGSCFITIGKSLQSQDLKTALIEGLNQIKKLGKAEFGDKTMVDVWTEVLNINNAAHITVEQIDDFITKSINLKAKKGRASYLNERSVGHIDPGTYSSGLFFKSLIEAGLL